MRHLLVVVAVAGAALALAASAAARTHAAAEVQTVVLTIHPAPASQLEHVSWRQVHARMAPDERVEGSNFAVRPGITVRVVVVNYTHMLHTFTAPELQVNEPILPGSATHPVTSVFTFVPRTYGRIPWWCAAPCGGYMGGNVYVIGD